VFEVKKELLDSHEALLDVVFEDETVDGAKRRAARKISREINIPGFRKGRAPYSKIQQYVGESSIMQEAAEMLVDETYPQIIEEAEVDPYGPGEFVDMQTTPLTLKIKVPLQPVIDLDDYQSIRLAWEQPTVSDEEVEQVLEQLREEHAVLEPVDHAAELGDQVMVNVKATTGDDVIVDEDDIEVVLSEERPFLSAEFVDALVGMQADETKEVDLVMPETIDEVSLRGVEAHFTVTVTQVLERTLPEIDDALASTVGSFETKEELEQDIRSRIRSSKEEQAESSYRSDLVSQLVERATVTYPPQLVADTLDDIVNETSQRVESQRNMPFEDALRLDGLTMEQFREQMRPQAETRVKRSLVLSKFAEAEGVEASDDDVVREYGDLLGRLNLSEQIQDRPIDIESDLGRNLRSSVLGRKVMDRLAEIGRGEPQEAELVVEEVAEEAGEAEEAEEADPGPADEA